MKKLFISQPMRGKTDEEILAERKNAIASAEHYLNEEVEVIDSFFDDFNGRPLEFLAKSIALLATADIAYFAEGWENARGCKIERECAEKYGIDIIEHIPIAEKENEKMDIKEVIEQLESLLHEAQYNRACSPEEYMYQRDVEALESAINILKHIPIADVAPVVHARWVDNKRGGYKWAFYCSRCGWIDGYPFNDRFKYCPNCGAKMVESEDEE